MATVRFILKEPQQNIPKRSQKESLIYLMLRYGKNRLKLSTGKKVYPYLWNEEKQEIRASSEFKQHDTYNAVLKEQKAIIERINDKLILNGEIPTNDKIKKQFQIEYKGFNKEEYTLNQFIAWYIKAMETGEITTASGKKYTKGTIKNYKGFQEQFNLYQSKKKRSLSYDDITIDFYNEFVRFFMDKNYSQNTIARHIKNLKRIMRLALDKGQHKSVEFTRKSFIAKTTTSESIYLTEKELKKMFELKFKEKEAHLEKARDIFLVGCYTAQRFSDYSRIGANNIITLDNGKKAIELIQQKTGTKVIVPIRPELDTILKKYNYILPKVYEQKLNKYIKEVGAKADIKNKIEIESVKGGLIVKTTAIKKDLIKTHTARRSGCTNMYLAGIPTLDIMKISGHKTEKEFLKYIKMTEKETAQNLSNHDYFNTPILKVIND